MKFEKRAAGGETPSQEPAVREARSKKPVIVYILILFLAAFLLMFLSLLSHQRSNSEALGRLQSSVSAIQEVQEENIALQKQLNELEAQLANAKADQETQQDLLQSDLQAERLKLDAMTNLYLLQQSYSAQAYETCMQIIQTMEESGQVEVLPTGSISDAAQFPPSCTTPADRYQELKAAVLNHQAP